MSSFHLTNMKRALLEKHIPKIINSLDEIAIEMKRSNRLKEKELALRERELELKYRELKNHS